MNLRRIFIPCLLFLLLTACTLPQATTPTLTPVIVVIAPTLTPAPPTATAQILPIVTQVQIPTTTASVPFAFCQDARVGALLDSFANALAASNGEALASLISPVNGLDVQFLRDGRVVNYDREHAKFVFESTYQVEWGLGAGSGAPVTGPFQQIVLPSLQRVFTPTAQRVCNQIKLGGATYVVTWPVEYASLNYYSVYFPGTDQYGGLDWQTWLSGVEIVNGQPFLRALLHFEWEP